MLDDPLDERVVDRVDGVDALDRGADLARVREAAPRDRLRGAIEVGVGADDRGRLAAELERARDQPLAARRRDLLAGRDRAGEHAVVDAAVDQRRAGRAAPGDDLEQIGRQLGREVQLASP